MSARDARVFGIRPRGPDEIIEQNSPWKVVDAACLGCGHLWSVMATIGTDESQFRCPFCGERKSVPEAEAPLFLPSLH